MSDNTENMDWLNDYPVLQKQSKENSFLVPDNFFEKQQERIHSAIFADELKQQIPSAGFTVSDGYFENMQEQILSVIKLEEMRDVNPEAVKSEAFFDEQQSIIAARIKISEYAALGSCFTVPHNYFDELTNKINKKTGIKEALPKPAVKVRNLFTRAAWKYATAACIAVAITTGVFVKKYQAAHNVQTQLSNLPDADIENYLQINSDSYENHIILENSTSDADLDLKTDQLTTDSNGNNNN